eukprot:maker-scaffold359_size197282-snap-gene-0.29 protein:Tk01288 transcript:maker-scaffold359_size197282-snap-gene-0.29-mRNA-1 annotation:"hypothetical protein"
MNIHGFVLGIGLLVVEFGIVSLNSHGSAQGSEKNLQSEVKRANKYSIYDEEAFTFHLFENFELARDVFVSEIELVKKLKDHRTRLAAQFNPKGVLLKYNPNDFNGTFGDVEDYLGAVKGMVFLHDTYSFDLNKLSKGLIASKTYPHGPLLLRSQHSLGFFDFLKFAKQAFAFKFYDRAIEFLKVALKLQEQVRLSEKELKELQKLKKHLVGYEVDALVPPRLVNEDPTPSRNHGATQVAINDVARNIAGKTRSDHIRTRDLLLLAGLPSLNELAVRATIVETWKAFHSSDGRNGTRNPIGEIIFPSSSDDSIDSRITTRSKSAGIILTPMHKTIDTFAVLASTVWNKYPELRAPKTNPKQKKIQLHEKNTGSEEPTQKKLIPIMRTWAGESTTTLTLQVLLLIISLSQGIQTVAPLDCRDNFNPLVDERQRPGKVAIQKRSYGSGQDSFSNFYHKAKRAQEDEELAYLSSLPKYRFKRAYHGGPDHLYRPLGKRVTSDEIEQDFPNSFSSIFGKRHAPNLFESHSSPRLPSLKREDLPQSFSAFTGKRSDPKHSTTQTQLLPDQMDNWVHYPSWYTWKRSDLPNTFSSFSGKRSNLPLSFSAFTGKRSDLPFDSFSSLTGKRSALPFDTFSSLTGKRSQFPDTFSSLTGKRSGFPESFSSFTGKRSDFPESFSSFTGKRSYFPQSFSSFTGKRSNFPESFSSFTGKRSDFPESFSSFTGKRSDIPESFSSFTGKRSDFPESFSSFTGKRSDFPESFSSFTGKRSDFPESFSSFTGKRSDFPESFSSFTGKRSNFPESFASFTGKRSDFPESFASFTGKRSDFPESFSSSTGKRSNFPESSFSFTGKRSNFPQSFSSFTGKRSDYPQSFSSFTGKRSDHPQTFSSFTGKRSADLDFPTSFASFTGKHSNPDPAKSRVEITRNEDVPIPFSSSSQNMKTKRSTGSFSHSGTIAKRQTELTMATLNKTDHLKTTFHKIASQILRTMNVSTRTMFPPSGMWGTDIGGGNFDGVIGTLQRQEAHLSNEPLTLGLERAMAVDFSLPVMTEYTGLTGLRGEAMRQINLWAFIDIITPESWVGFGLVVLVIIVIEMFHLNFSLGTSLKVVFLLLLQKDPNEPADKHSSRMLLLTIGMFSFVVFSFYTALLTSTMTVKSDGHHITNFEDVPRLGYELLVMKSSFFESTLKLAQPGTLLYKLWRSAKEDTVEFQTIFDALRARQKSVVLFTKYFEAPPDTRELSLDWYFAFPNGIGLQKDSELAPLINHEILKLERSGILHKIIQDYEKVVIPKEGPTGDSNPLGMQQLLLLIYVLTTGCMASVAIIGIEYGLIGGLLRHWMPGLLDKGLVAMNGGIQDIGRPGSILSRVPSLAHI